MNNKGFMMAEVIVVSAIIMVSLTGFYISYNKIISIYNTRINYYDVPTLYELAYIRDNNDISNSTVLDSSGYRRFYGDVKPYDSVYCFEYAKLKPLPSMSLTFQDYINFILNSITFTNDKILVMENCSDTEKTNCKYSYLEVAPE